MKCKMIMYPIVDDIEILSCEPMPYQGYCNTNYLLQTENAKYHLRHFKLTTIDRNKEFEIQKMAFESKIAPKPFVLDEKNNQMLCEYIEGEHTKTLDEISIFALAKTLQKLHHIKSDFPLMNLRDSFKTHTPKIKKALKAIEKFSLETVLCHNDLNPKNILFREGKVILIDWEFAGVNDCYFDLASVSVEFEMSEEKERFFCESYFGSIKVNSRKLRAYKTIYRLICAEWLEELQK